MPTSEVLGFFTVLVKKELTRLKKDGKWKKNGDFCEKNLKPLISNKQYRIPGRDQFSLKIEKWDHLHNSCGPRGSRPTEIEKILVSWGIEDFAFTKCTEIEKILVS